MRSRSPKSSCTGCGCKYERDCESGPQGAWCWTSCLCPAGTPDSCMGNKLSALRGVKISKSASQTIYRLKVAPEIEPYSAVIVTAKSRASSLPRCASHPDFARLGQRPVAQRRTRTPSSEMRVKGDLARGDKPRGRTPVIGRDVRQIHASGGARYCPLQIGVGCGGGAG